jgi:hypothetical protein
MFKTVVLLLFLASPLMAQDDASRAWMAAGCGPNDISFDVKTDKKQHPTAQPPAGKALVFVFANTIPDNAHIAIGGWISRFGVDGVWVGATSMKSYFFFPIDPGEHHLCVSIQSKSVEAYSAAVSFSATAGSVYYFTTKDPNHPMPKEQVKLVALDPAEADLYIASSPFSTFHQKK